MLNQNKVKTIKLVPMSLEMVDNYLVWFNDEVVRKFLNFATPRRREDIEHWIQEVMYSDNCSYFAIFVPDCDCFIGHVGLKNINFLNKSAEIGIVIGEKDFWRKGVGTKAIIEIISYAKKLALKRVIAKVLKNNVPSQRLFSKLGFIKTNEHNDDLYFYFVLELE